MFIQTIWKKGKHTWFHWEAEWHLCVCSISFFQPPLCDRLCVRCWAIEWESYPLCVHRPWDMQCGRVNVKITHFPPSVFLPLIIGLCSSSNWEVEFLFQPPEYGLALWLALAKGTCQKWPCATSEPRPSETCVLLFSLLEPCLREWPGPAQWKWEAAWKRAERRVPSPLANLQLTRDTQWIHKAPRGAWPKVLMQRIVG